LPATLNLKGGSYKCLGTRASSVLAFGLWGTPRLRPGNARFQRAGSRIVDTPRLRPGYTRFQRAGSRIVDTPCLRPGYARFQRAGLRIVGARLAYGLGTHASSVLSFGLWGPPRLRSGNARFQRAGLRIVDTPCLRPGYARFQRAGLRIVGHASLTAWVRTLPACWPSDEPSGCHASKMLAIA